MVGHMSASAEPTFLDQVISREGVVEPDRLSVVLRITEGELAAASGLSLDAVSKTRRRQAPATQARLRAVAEIINRVLPWCGSVPQASPSLRQFRTKLSRLGVAGAATRGIVAD
jgi:hypothetical protein